MKRILKILGLLLVVLITGACGSETYETVYEDVETPYFYQYTDPEQNEYLNKSNEELIEVYENQYLKDSPELEGDPEKDIQKVIDYYLGIAEDIHKTYSVLIIREYAGGVKDEEVEDLANEVLKQNDANAIIEMLGTDTIREEYPNFSDMADDAENQLYAYSDAAIRACLTVLTEEQLKNLETINLPEGHIKLILEEKEKLAELDTEESEKPTEETRETEETESTEEETTEQETETNAETKEPDYSAALSSAQAYAGLGISEQSLKDQLESSYSEEEVEYAMENVKIDYDEEALTLAKSYKESGLGTDEIYEQLIYEKFTPEQAQYAVDNLE